ncbi:MAG: alpha/beta hydrolase [Helicobacteraceae bacterium]|nr:alpha/beta hydrolase [Helicobacteraceae bacterium]
MALKNISLVSKSFEISYILQNNTKNKWALFLHGWGANKELMQNAFKNTFREYNHLYLDLPGFGNSSNDYVLDSKDYCKIAQAFLKTLNITPSVIIGHSFGGKIATLLNPNKLVLLSSAGIIKKKSLKVKVKIKLAKIAKFFHIKTKIFRTKDADNLAENMYETLKIVVNEDFSEIFSKFSNKAFIFWGDNDETTPLYMAETIESLIKDSKLYVLKGNHFFFLNNADFIDRITNGNNK